ncbi:MAG: Hsp70 family protein [Acidobacteriota bacterium]|jgi:molecular chaperone DnaK
MSEPIVGIDLGTTNSELAVVLDGKLQVVPIHGNPIMPSCVGLDPSGRLIVGRTARNQLIAAPEATVMSIKRRMGESPKVRVGNREFSPEEISSFILRELKQEGERQLGFPIRKAVITVPAYFNERQRKATQDAGELAGLEVVRILNEPTAAALAYGAEEAAGGTLLIYDLGGGTFDLSVVVVESGIVEVKSSHGDTHLGGDDFDQLLANQAAAQFKKAYGVDLGKNLKALRRLKVAMEAAKCRLSDEPFVMVREEFLDGKHHLELEVLRADYEEMISPLLEKTLACLHHALSDAKLTPRDVSKVMLVGGATRTPLVHRLLQERLQLEPRFEIDPDLIVAMGAAIQASVLAGQRRHSILVDITPHTLSTGAMDFESDFPRLVCVPIIPRNTPLPAGKSELFQTMYDGQETVEVSAYQGEAHYPEENTLVGKFKVNGLADVSAGNKIVIQFDLDLNGMLKATAKEKATGLSRTVTMDTRGKSVLDLEQARRNVAALVGTESHAHAPADPHESHSLLATAKDLRKRAEVLLAKNLNENDAVEIRRLLQESSVAIGERLWQKLSAINDSLADLLFYLED